MIPFAEGLPGFEIVFAPGSPKYITLYENQGRESARVSRGVVRPSSTA